MAAAVDQLGTYRRRDRTVAAKSNVEDPGGPGRGAVLPRNQRQVVGLSLHTTKSPNAPGSLIARLLDRLKQPNVCVSAAGQPYDALASVTMSSSVAAQDNWEQVQCEVKRSVCVKTPVRQSCFARRALH